jgi:hypothetical protein
MQMRKSNIPDTKKTTCGNLKPAASATQRARAAAFATHKRSDRDAARIGTAIIRVNCSRPRLPLRNVAPRHYSWRPNAASQSQQQRAQSERASQPRSQRICESATACCFAGRLKSTASLSALTIPYDGACHCCRLTFCKLRILCSRRTATAHSMHFRSMICNGVDRLHHLAAAK